MLESMSGWLTPTSLFLLLNVVIGTIWVTTHFGSHRSSPPHDHQEGPQHSSQPSMFQRVRSLNFGLQRYDHHHSDGDNHHFPPSDHAYTNIAPQPHPHAQPTPSVSRAPSILQRVRSRDFQFSFLGSDQPQPHPEPESDPSPVQEGPDLRTRLLARAPSLLQRVKSITFTDLPQISLFRSEPPVAESKIQHAESEPLTDLDWGRFEEVLHGGDEHHARRTKSDLKKKASSAKKKKMKRSASEKIDLGQAAAEEAAEETERRRPATTRVERTPSFGGDVEVDSKADDFINKFKNQLKLQRLNSFAQYRDMITRGASR